MKTIRTIKSPMSAGAILLAAVAALPLLPAEAPLVADVETGALAKYDKPVDEAIDRALAYLAKQQNEDGSFGNENRGAITGLCVMAFLAKGHLPGLGPYGDTINRGVDYVLSHTHSTGLLSTDAQAHGVMYTHGICSLMLSEVSGMLDPDRQKKVDDALAKAMRVILAAQTVRKDPKNQGGWRYQPGSNDSDISCTGWQLMALRSARNNGAQVPREAIENAVKYIMNCKAKGGGFSYQPGGQPGEARTGTALLCLELCGKHRDQATLEAGNWLLTKLPRNFGGDFFYYGLYYCTQGMFQLGDKYWENWAQNLYELMLKFQNSDGSWPPGGGNESKAGPCYSTAMGVLAISVAYRQLPIYQRSSS